MSSRPAVFVSTAVCALLVPGSLQAALLAAGPQKADSKGTAISLPNQTLPAGARLYVAPMPNGFETYVVAGLREKKVPLVVTTIREKADFELTGVSETDQAGWARTLVLTSDSTNETASVKIVNLKSGQVVFADSVKKINSNRGKQTAGEAVANHINEKIGHVLALPRAAQQAGSSTLKAGATVFIAPMEDGFDDYLKNAIRRKQVPITVVADKSLAEFEISGHSDTHNLTTSRKLLVGVGAVVSGAWWRAGELRSDEQTSIQVANLESGEVVFAYSANKRNSISGKQSSAEACAKHLKTEIEKKKP